MGPTAGPWGLQNELGGSQPHGAVPAENRQHGLERLETTLLVSTPKHPLPHQECCSLVLGVLLTVWVLPYTLLGARVSTVAFGVSPWRHRALLAGCLMAFGRALLEPNQGVPQPGVQGDKQLTFEVAVVAQVVVHEAVVGLRDSLGRTVPSGPAHSQGWQPPVLLPIPLAAPNLGSEVPQEPHGFERHSTLSCPLLLFPDAVAQ